MDQGRLINLFLRNTSFGIFIGAELTLVSCWTNSPSGVDEITSTLSTQLTIGATLLASAVALAGVLFNIENQNVINEQNRHKKFLACRAFLPQALSELFNLCRNGMKYSFKFHQFEAEFGKIEFEEKSIKDLCLSDGLTSILKEIIEFSDEASVSDRLSGILREHQILLARWKGEFTTDNAMTIRLPSYYSQRTVAWAYLGAICASMLQFARGETKIVNTKVTYVDISGIIATSDIADLDPDEHVEAINLYARNFDRRFTV